MKKTIMIVGFFVLAQTVSAFDYKGDMEKMRTFVEIASPIIRSFGQSPKEVIAVVYGEHLHFLENGDVQNSAEEIWNEALYVQLGRIGQDKSIGPTQTKPSFAGDTEDSIRIIPDLAAKFSQLLTFQSEDQTTIRSERLDRLKNLEQEIVYVCAFFAYMEHKFPPETFDSTQEKIKFYAAAYNWGISGSKQAIDWWKDIAAFPYGKKDPKSVPYGDIAVYFFANYDEHFSQTSQTNQKPNE